jgi:hypothetical protein
LAVTQARTRPTVAVRSSSAASMVSWSAQARVKTSGYVADKRASAACSSPGKLVSEPAFRTAQIAHTPKITG